MLRVTLADWRDLASVVTPPVTIERTPIAPSPERAEGVS